MEPIKSLDPSSVAVYSLDPGAPLAARVCRHLGIGLAPVDATTFEDGEHKIRPLEDVRGKDVYVVQSLYGDRLESVNDRLCRLLFFLHVLRDGGAARLTAVVPYLCYARQDRRTQAREPVHTRYVASLIESTGIDCMVTMDVHDLAAFQNAFRIPSVHLTGAPLFADELGAVTRDGPVAVVSPDAGGMKRAHAFRKLLADRFEAPVRLAFVEKFRDDDGVSGRRVIGDVTDAVTVVLDDLVSTAGTLAHAADACNERGALGVYAAATHGVFVGDAVRRLREASFAQLFVLDTIPPSRLPSDLSERRVRVLESAPVFAEAIARLHRNEPVSDLCGFH